MFTYIKTGHECYNLLFVTARSELCKVLLLALSVTLLFVYEISRETLNGFAPSSQGRRVWYLARTSLKVKVNFGGLRASLLMFESNRRYH